MDINQRILLVVFLVISAFLRFFNLMHDSPYFFNPDERNMANSISQFKLPRDFSQIPICLISQFSQKPTTNDQRPTTNCNLNPHFFAYGQFPLYLSFISDQVIRSFWQVPTNAGTRPESDYGQARMTSFSSAIFWLRFWSAISSIATILMVYLITKELTNNYILRISNFKFQISNLAALSAAFTPGLIQSAHFGTTESLLTFFFLVSVYLSIRYLSDLSNIKFILLISLSIGLSLGSKLTGIFFFIPPFLALMIQTIKLLKKRKKKLFIGLFENLRIGLFLIIGSILIFVLSSAYNLVDPDNFKSAVFGYESDVATGKYEAFYTRQFVNTVPILFQAEKIFPYTLGLPLFILGTLGFLLITLQLIINILLIGRKLQINGKINYLKIDNSFIILNLSFIIYFLPNAFLFAKWTRFMTPIFPFFAIFSAFALMKIYSVLNVSRFQFSIPKFQFSLNFKKLKIKNLDLTENFKFQISNYSLVYWSIGLLVITPILSGLMFMSIYTHEDSRLTASKWIYTNIPDTSYVLSETANVVDIPLGLPENLNTSTKNYEVISFNFYNLDENPTLFTQLIDHLEKANYIFIPSRRIFADYPKLPQKYPLVTKYYQLLFSGALGFEKVSEISSFPQLLISQIGPIRLIGNDENAEETFTVFDHPVVRIYRKIKPMTIDEYRSLFMI